MRRALLAVSDDDVRVALADYLRARGVDVVEVAHARSLHHAVLRATDDPWTQSFDAWIVEEALDGCSPLHAISFARRHGLEEPVVLLTRAIDRRVQREGEQLSLLVCTPQHAFGAIEGALFPGEAVAA